MWLGRASGRCTPWGLGRHPHRGTTGMEAPSSCLCSPPGTADPTLHRKPGLGGLRARWTVSSRPGWGSPCRPGTLASEEPGAPDRSSPPVLGRWACSKGSALDLFARSRGKGDARTPAWIWASAPGVCGPPGANPRPGPRDLSSCGSHIRKTRPPWSRPPRAPSLGLHSS